MTSSASASGVGGSEAEHLGSLCVDERLKVDCMTGKSAVFAPLRMCGPGDPKWGV
jgi:hypothetical protein